MATRDVLHLLSWVLLTWLLSRVDPWMPVGFWAVLAALISTCCFWLAHVCSEKGSAEAMFAADAALAELNST